MPIISDASIQKAVAALVPTAGSAPPVENPYEIHLNLAGIMGESGSSAHADEIELTSFSWGVSNDAISAQRDATKAGRVSVSEITVTKSIDKASIQLLKAATQNQQINKGVITWSKSTGGKKPEDFMTVTLERVYVASVRQNSSHASAGMGTETVTLSFQKINVDYKVQGKDGLLTSAGSMSYAFVK